MEKGLPDTDEDFMAFAKTYMELVNSDIKEGFYDYSENAKKMYTQPRSFLYRMVLKFGLNPYDRQNETNNRIPGLG